MSAHKQLEDDRQPVVDAGREWAVYRCAHGCFHLALDRVTLTLSEDEFHALQKLMRKACQRFPSLQPHGPSPVRAH